MELRVWHSETYYVIATANYSNGGFLMNLPAKMHNHFLKPVESIFAEKIIPDGVSVSDPNAKVIPVDFLFAFKSCNKTGHFDYEYDVDDYDYTLAWYVYADRDFGITGSYSYASENSIDFYSYDISLRKGWNEVYTTYDYSYETHESRINLYNVKPQWNKMDFSSLSKFNLIL
jgi:hypothetical protein